jgi:hypothetical protein
MSISDRIASLKTLITELEDDANKTDKGNKAAGTRVRKALAQLASDSKEIRKEVLEATRKD